MSEKNIIFVGNTGEKDPEIHETLGRKYPSQVKKVWTRNVKSRIKPEQMDRTKISGMMEATIIRE